MSQNIADMPGIEAAIDRFNAMDGTNGTNATNGSNATSAIAKTDATADTSGEGALRAREARALPTTTRDPSRVSDSNKADAQPTVNKEPLPHGWQRHLPSGSDDQAQNSVSPTTDARAATDTKQTVTGAADNGNQQRDEKGRFQAANEDGRSKIEDGKQTNKPSSSLNPPSSQSRYAKAQERLEKTWEGVNKRKGDLDAQAQQLEQQRQTLERDRAQFEAVRRQAEQPQATPEQAVQAAQARRRDADALRMQAKRADDAGRFDEAQRLNKQADKAESLADELGSYAEELRKNPPVSMQQRQQQFEQARKQWTMEACNAFPDLAKNGSRLQQVVAQHLDAMAKQDPQLLVHPSLIYHVARLADAQTRVADLQSVAARVPVLEKEAESLRARIKELEAETTPAGNGGVSRLGEPARDDYASLRQSAAELGHERW
jgi:hypothetical protein